MLLPRPLRWRTGGDLITLAAELRAFCNRVSKTVAWSRSEILSLTTRELIQLQGDLNV